MCGAILGLSFPFLRQRVSKAAELGGALQFDHGEVEVDVGESESGLLRALDARDDDFSYGGHGIESQAPSLLSQQWQYPWTPTPNVLFEKP